MQAKLKIIRINDVAKTAPSSGLDLQATKQNFVDSAWSNVSASDVAVLLDCRDAPSVLTMDHIAQLAAEFDAYRPAFREKIAVVVDAEGRLDQAKDLEQSVNKNNGLQLHVFDNLGDAVEWLFPTSESSLE